MKPENLIEDMPESIEDLEQRKLLLASGQATSNNNLPEDEESEGPELLTEDL